MNEIFQATILGIVQGLTEFLPISSSAHLVLVPWLFGWEDPGLTFDVALHFGTLVAVVVYFWRDLIEIVSSVKYQVSSRERKEKSKYPKNMIWLLVVATIPGALAGWLLNDLAETAFRNPLLIAFALIFFGFLLFVADKKGKKTRKTDKLKMKDAVIVGLAQALAIIPGTSRSGVTITAGLMRGLTRKSAARFSFLLSVPIIFGATLFEAKDFFSSSIGVAEIAGIVAAAVSGWFAIDIIIRFVEKTSYKIYFWYRLALALVIVAFYLSIWK